MRKTFRSVINSTTAITLLFAATAAHAELTTYRDQAAYLAAVGNTGVDTFNDLDIEPYDTPFPRAAGDYTYVVTAGPGNPRAYGASDDDYDWYLSTSRRTDSLTFSDFGTPIAGAGGFFWGSDIAGYSVAAPYVMVTATDSTGDTLTFTINNPTPWSFLGFVSDARIVSLSVATGDQLGADGFGIWPTVNNLHLSVAAPVPEPATWGMLAAGFGLLGFMARRRKR